MNPFDDTTEDETSEGDEVPFQDSGATYLVRGATLRAPKLEPALYLVATPIGNLSDVTLRALDIIAGSDVLACEDTRVTQKLLSRYGIRRRLFAYHEHNAAESGPALLDELEAGRSVALVSDAGTPLVSTPASVWAKRPSRAVCLSYPFRAPPRRWRHFAPRACRPTPSSLPASCR